MIESKWETLQVIFCIQQTNRFIKICVFSYMKVNEILNSKLKTEILIQKKKKEKLNEKREGNRRK